MLSPTNIVTQHRGTHLKWRLRGYYSDLLLDLREVCAVFLKRYPREFAT